jgi:glyoxylase-like metal-dependent hydrolase (beta-lactamase superfamily II)
LSIYINGEKVAIFHVDHAHTDGDAMLYFTEGNVLHTGDVYFNHLYPFIDLNSGGSVKGYIEAVKKGLSVINDDTKIIPGHGKASNKAEYEVFLTMLESLKAKVLAEIEKGRTEEEVAADATITKTYDDLGYSWNFISSEKIRRTFYSSLKN